MHAHDLVGAVELTDGQRQGYQFAGLVITALVALYLFPTIVAAIRHVPNIGSIAVINIFAVVTRWTSLAPRMASSNRNSPPSCVLGHLPRWPAASGGPQVLAHELAAGSLPTAATRPVRMPQRCGGARRRPRQRRFEVTGRDVHQRECGVDRQNSRLPTSVVSQSWSARWLSSFVGFRRLDGVAVLV